MNYKQPLELTGLIANLDAFFREHLSPFWASVVEGLLILIAIVALYAVIALALIYVERKITGFFQSRLGPQPLGKIRLHPEHRRHDQDPDQRDHPYQPG